MSTFLFPDVLLLLFFRTFHEESGKFVKNTGEEQCLEHQFIPGWFSAEHTGTFRLTCGTIQICTDFVKTVAAVCRRDDMPCRLYDVNDFISSSYILPVTGTGTDSFFP